MATIVVVENGKNHNTAPLYIVRGPYPGNSLLVQAGKASVGRKRTLRKRLAAGKRMRYVSYQSI